MRAPSKTHKETRVLSLVDELRLLQSEWQIPEQIIEPSLETEDELFDLIVQECRSRAEAGCSTYRFEWGLASTRNKAKWEATYITREAVIKRLKSEGLFASGKPESFPEKYLNAYDELDHQTGRHFITVEWGPHATITSG
jgi:hypothetical protein